MSHVVCASEYGGPNDPTSGTTGYRGDSLPGKMAFAELKMGTALGGLPHGSKVQVEYNGRSVIAEKLDIGLGGPGCGGVSRDIDLWYQTAQALGFSGLGTVTVTLEHEGKGPQTKNALFGLPFPPTPSLPGEFGGVPSPGKIIEKAKQGIGSVEELGKLIQLLSTRDGWVRIGKVVVGLFLLMSGVLDMARLQAPEPVSGFNRGVGTAKRTHKNIKDATELAAVLAK